MTRFAAPLTSRQTEILLAVVQEHVRTRAPVGSKVVQERYGVKASTATIRNEMMELEQAGYLCQPHTSAGRVPCDSAYRLYVNYLAASGLPEPSSSTWVQGEYRRLGSDPHELLRETSRLLARITSHPAVVTSPPVAEPIITAIRVQPVSGTSALLHYKTSTGEERHHLLQSEETVTAAQLAALSQALEKILVNRRVSALANLSLTSLKALMKEHTAPASLLRAISQAAEADDEGEVYVDGTSYILDEPEFAEHDLLRGFMQVLDEEYAVRQVLREAIESREMTVTIGVEHRLPTMRGCSLVASSYPYADARGAVGILGPTRMDYGRAMGAVAFMTRRLAAALEESER